jgi:DNA (cytosine-5)-methyltransferase 1
MKCCHRRVAGAVLYYAPSSINLPIPGWPMNAAVVDLFCGIGGLTHGFVKEGFDVVAGIDSDPSCKFAFEANNNNARFISRDIANVTGAEVRSLFPGGTRRILIGCAPCSPFSKYTLAKAGYKHEKWALLRSFATLVSETKAHVVSMENVTALERYGIYREFKKSLEQAGYYVTRHRVRCADYGVPQTRKRLVLFASKYGEVDLVNATHANNPQTVREVIGHLPSISAGEASARDPIHLSRKLSEINLRRIKATPPAGGWEAWDDELVLKCHKKKKGRSYRSVYGRMRWDDLAPTITTQCVGLGNGRFGHPEQDRAISVREAALLQTFPMKYQFVERHARVKCDVLARHIGNAVPVRLGVIIARSIKRHLEEHAKE